MTTRTVCLVFEYSTLNGGERSMLAVLEWLTANDTRWKFIAVAPSEGELKPALESLGVTVFSWSTADETNQQRSSVANDTDLIRIISEHDCHLIHANSLSMGRITGRNAAKLSVPTTAHLRDIIKLSRTTIDDLNGNRQLVAVSQATKQFHAAQGLDEQRVVVIHNGVDLEQFQPRPRSGRLMTELEIGCSAVGSAIAMPRTTPTKIIATIGQIGLRKGQDVLAAAAPCIVSQVPNAHFVFIGERTSQKQESIEFERAVESTFRQHALQDHLHRLGYRNDVADLLCEVDLLVHPANQEPFGRVLLEASACGLPIVATDVGGTREIILDGVTGRLVPPRDPSALADAVVDVLTNDSLAKVLGQNARERASREFPVSLAAQRLAQLWDEVLKEESRNQIQNPLRIA